MNHALADTSIFIAREGQRFVQEELIPPLLFVSVITYAELRAGVLATSDATSRARRLSTLEAIPSEAIVPISASVAEVWASLRVSLRDAGKSMKVNDSWIAATAISLDVPIVTQDADFEGVPGLVTIRV